MVTIYTLAWFVPLVLSGRDALAGKQVSQANSNTDDDLLKTAPDSPETAIQVRMYLCFLHCAPLDAQSGSHSWGILHASPILQSVHALLITHTNPGLVSCL